MLPPFPTAVAVMVSNALMAPTGAGSQVVLLYRTQSTSALVPLVPTAFTLKLPSVKVAVAVPDCVPVATAR